MNLSNAVVPEFVPLGNVLTFKTPTGRPSGFELPPHPFESTDAFTPATANKADPKARVFADPDPSTSRSAIVMRINHRLTEKMSAIQSDAKLSKAGKQEAIDAEASAALAEIGAAHNELATLGAQIEAQRANLYAPPKVTAEIAPIDVELRSYFNSLDNTAQLRMLETLNRPEMTNMLHALLRSPLPLAEQTRHFVMTAQEKRVAAAKPEEAHRLRVASENHDWSNRFAGHIAQGIAKSAWPTRDSRGFNTQLAWNALRGVKATSLLGFSRADQTALEQRAQLQAQRQTQA